MQSINSSEVLNTTTRTVLMLGVWHKPLGTLYLLGVSLPGAFQLPTKQEHLGLGGSWAVFQHSVAWAGRHTALLYS